MSGYYEYIMDKARKQAKNNFEFFVDILHEDGMIDQLIAEDMGLDNNA